MNRIFHIIMWGTACLLISGFVILIASMLIELGQESLVRPPHLDEVSFAVKLSLITSTPLGRQIDQRFGPFVFEVKGIVLAQFLVVVGLSIRLLKTTFEGIDVEYENLARTLGYDQMRVFFKVVLPMAGKGLVASFLLVWARARR